MPTWMRPDGLGPQLLVGVLLVATVVWGVWFLPRTLRERVKQAIFVIASVALSLALVGLSLNRSNQWYPTWSSLVPSFSIDSVNHHGTPAPDTAATGWVEGEPSSRQRDPVANPAFAGHDWGSDGDYLDVTVPGSGVDAASTSALIWLPPSYRSHPERFYPVIVAFSGIPGVPGAFRDNLEVGRRIMGLVAERKIREAIVVSPEIFPNNLDTECVDSSDGSVRIESFVTTQFLEWVETNLRTVEDPKAWATLGYSAGGWCSTMMTMRHPNAFGYSINLSGYFTPLFEGTKLLDVDDHRYDLAALAANERPAVDIWFLTAKDDDMPMTQVEQFAPHVVAPTSLSSSIVAEGGHSWAVWTEGAETGLAWLGRKSSQFGWQQA